MNHQTLKQEIHDPDQAISRYFKRLALRSPMSIVCITLSPFAR